jgi:hypothetical protein
MRRRLDRGVWVTYLLVGAALALFRVSLLAWVEHRSVTHGRTEAVYNLLWGLRREGFLGEYTPVGAIHFESVTLHFLFWASLLTLGSFISAMPVLLVGWLR